MTRFFLRGTRTLAVATLLGATGFTTAQATEWNQIQGSNWGGSNAGASAGMSSGGTQQSGSANAGTGTEIATAFQNLGMDPARAECYGKVLAQELSPGQQQEAAALVRTASNSTDVRTAVLNEGPTMVGSFSAANSSCPEGMGG